MQLSARPLSLFLTVLSLTWPLIVQAQTATGVIVGAVQDSAGSALVGAKVEVDPIDREVVSDNQGQFRIPNLPPGKYTLTASYVGFKAFSGDITVTEGRTESVTAMLEVGSGADSVIVTAPRLQGEAEAINVERMSSQIVQVETSGVIQSLPNTNVADAVGRLPSVSSNATKAKVSTCRSAGQNHDSIRSRSTA